MHLFINILLLLIGFAALIKGADFFVDGSSALARHFKIPGIIIGLTIVAMGTSAPELAVSTSAALKGANEIALSNVVGSNLFNLLAVLGICAMIHPLPIDRIILKRDFPISIGLTLLTLAVTGLPFLLTGSLTGVSVSDSVGSISRGFGILLLVLFVSYIAMLVISARKQPAAEETEKTAMPLWKCGVLITAGLACIILGGQCVVSSAKTIAAALGMSETLIGLTIVAIGTSLPELVTSVVASCKGENGLALGNVIGSNIFNILFILGISGTIHPIAVNLASVMDLAILAAVHLMVLFFARTRHVSRTEGAVMTVVYAASMLFAILR